jgi:hypothetical protein
VNTVVPEQIQNPKSETATKEHKEHKDVGKRLRLLEAAKDLQEREGGQRLRRVLKSPIFMRHEGRL